MKKHIYKDPVKYSQNNKLQYNFALNTLSKISLDSNSRVLDIGCGDGIITYEIAKLVDSGCVIGTDISPQMIEYASKSYLEQKNLRFIQMDAAQNIFRCQFDIITSFNCLHWVKDQEKALTGIAHAASDNAQILLLLSHKKSNYHFVLDTLCSSNKWRQYFTDFVSPRSFFDCQLYKEMVIQSGLNVVNIIEEEMTYSFNKRDQLKDFFSAAGSQIKQIPDNLKDEFLDDFVEEFLRKVDCSEENLIPVSFWCLQVIASKPVYRPSIKTDCNSLFKI